MRSELPPGYSMRAATFGDLAAVVAVGRACDLADLGEVDIHEEWVRDDWRRPRFDVATDAWIVVDQRGEVVAAAFTWDEEPRVIFDSVGWVHPDHRGLGIGTVLVRAVEARSMRDAAAVPPGSVPRVHQSFDAQNGGARSLFEGLGYRHEREFLHMQIEVASGFRAGPPPDRIAIRPRREQDDPTIFAAMDEAFRAHWGYRYQPYDEWIEQWQGSDTYDPTLWLVATEGDRVAGALLANVVDQRGWVGDLGVREGWRRRGIGEALLKEVFALFAERGIASVMLNVDRDNTTGATRLYERAGMRLRRSWLVVAKTMTETMTRGA